MPIISLTLLVLKTRKIEKLRHFYQMIGIDFTEEKHGNGPVHYSGKVRDTVIEIYPIADTAQTVDSSTRLGFAVDNVAALLDRLRSHDAEVVSAAKTTAWGLQAVVRDPDGRSVVLLQK